MGKAGEMWRPRKEKRGGGGGGKNGGAQTATGPGGLRQRQESVPGAGPSWGNGRSGLPSEDNKLWNEGVGCCSSLPPSFQMHDDTTSHHLAGFSFFFLSFFFFFFSPHKFVF